MKKKRQKYNLKLKNGQEWGKFDLLVNSGQWTVGIRNQEGYWM